MGKRKLSIELARAYEPIPVGDAYRVLVDRLWPRGIKKENLKLDHWAKDLAPSSELRRWFHQEPSGWSEFRRRYFQELDANASAVAELLQAAQGRTIVLIYAARDTVHNNAVALQEYLQQRGQ